VGVAILGFATWAGWAMTHTIHAKEVEAEIPSEAGLDLRDDPTPADPAMDPSTAPAEPTNSA